MIFRCLLFLLMIRIVCYFGSHIQVSCPGVWLCPEGDVTLAVFALGGSHRTERLPPSFPLNYKNTFYFRKTFRSCSLNNLQAALKDETIYCELVQWRCDCEAQVLAQYLGSLSDVLFPPDTCTSDGVDLLMRSTNDFPGILAPKIELSTKVRVDEVFEDSDENKDDDSKLSPLGGTTSNESNIKRQKPVCHTKLYHRNRCNLSPNRKSGRNSPSNRSPEPTYVSPVFTTATVKCDSCRTRSPSPPTPGAAPAPANLLTCSPMRCRRRSPPGPVVPLLPYPSYDDKVKLKCDETSEELPQREISLNSDSRQWKADIPVRISSLTNRHERVTRILESNYMGVPQGNTTTEREAQQWLHHHHNSGVPCVCEICRRYHQLFHVN